MRIYKINWVLRVTLTLLLSVTNSSPLSTSSPQELHSAIEEHEIERVKELIISKNSDDTDNYSSYSYYYDQSPLHTAIRADDIEITKLLLDHNENVDARDDDGFTPLAYVATLDMPNGPALAQLLIGKGAQVDLADYDGKTPLARAVFNGSYAIAKFLIDAGAHIDKNDSELLLKAVRSGSVPLLELLVSQGFMVNNLPKDVQGKLIVDAIESKKPEMLAWLFAHGIEAIPTSEVSGTQTIIHTAALMGNRAIIKILLDRLSVQGHDKALINKQTVTGSTPLHHAVWAGDLGAVEQLIQHGADPQITNEDGNTPLQLAVIHGETEIAEFLLAIQKERAAHTISKLNLLHQALSNGNERLAQSFIASGVPINSEDENGDTPLFVAIKTGSDLVPFLIAKGADVNHKNHEQRMPLHIAALSNNVKSIEALLKAGAQINAQDMEGSTPLLDALESYSPSAAETLLKAGADARIKNNQGITALHYAIKDEMFPWQGLIQSEADVNARTVDGDTPLHYAAQSGNISAVNALIAAGAQVNTTDALRRTPLHNAAKSFSSNIEGVIQALINSGASVDVKDAQGDTPLMLGLENSDVIKVLLANGANPFIANKNGQWALEKVVDVVDEGYFEASSFFELVRGSFNYLKRNVQERGLTHELKNYANRLYGLVAKGRKRLNNYQLENGEARYKINTQKILSDLSSMFRLTSAPPSSVNIAELLTISDISVVDDKSVAKPADALPFIPEKPPYTQTQSYLSKEQLKNKVLSSYKGEIVKYPRLIRKIIQQEGLFKDYDVFYHGQKRDFIVLYDVIKEIQNWLNKVPDTPEFEYVRLPEGQDKKLSEYLVLDSLMDDTTPEMVKHLLSVNLALFGSTSQWGSSTFSYFLESRNMRPPEDLLQEVFTKLGLNADYIPEILETLELIESPTGNLLQIFIPHGKVNEYVYLSIAMGVPLSAYDARHYTTLLPITVSDKTGAKHTYNLEHIDAKTYLDIYRNYPEAVSTGDMDLIQARINITHDFLLNPKSGVKIFRYNTVPPEKMQQYKQKLHEIMTKVMTEWEEKNKANLQNSINSAYSSLEDTLTSTHTTDSRKSAA